MPEGLALQDCTASKPVGLQLAETAIVLAALWVVAEVAGTEAVYVLMPQAL